MATSKRELLDTMNKELAQPGTVAYSKRQMELLVTCVEDVENAVLKLDASIRKSSDSSEKLGGKLVWLNGVLAVATAVGAIATFLQTIK